MQAAIKTTLESATHWAEWQRIELLCLCLLKANEGPPAELLNELKTAQSRVVKLRQGKWWSALPVSLADNELDVLACIYAPQIIPRVGWLLQDLQHTRKPEPTEGLIASILALSDSQLEGLRTIINHLEKSGLIVREQEGPFASIHPDKIAIARLMDWTEQDYAPTGAYPVKAKASWGDLVLPQEQLDMLHEFLFWLEHKQTVVDEWGGQITGGPVAMFTGPPGTGKTLAASVLANAMAWPLFRVDLAALVSKYIGETEKNIGRLFDATHGRNIFLQFDEVDALMGKRGELREARDRYANMEVSYLLARIEEHDGPCILTTNLRSQIDKAFCRRFQMVIEFPRPDVSQRRKLWQQLLPARAPLADGLDLDLVASTVSLSGGQIRNATLHAAYLAAAEKSSISNRHIAVAVYRELSKEQTQVNFNQLGDLARYLRANESLQPVLRKA